MSELNTNTSIIPFQFDNQQIRIIKDDQGDPWFVAKDVAIVLEYSATKDMTRWLDDDEKGVNTVPTPGGNQDMTIISESGLYSAILKSRKDKAKKFKRWVTHEVLPSIRKHGMYATPEVIEKALSDPEAMIRILQALQEERQLRKAAEETNNLLMHSEETVTTTDLAKELGFRSAQAFYRDLKNRRIAFKPQGSDHYVLYSEHVGKGWAIAKDEIVNGRVVRSLRWTQRGRNALLFMYKDRANMMLM